MKLIFLGSFVNPRDMKLFPNISVAGNKMQYNLLKKLSKKDVNLEIFSFKPHAKYPAESKVFIRSSKELMDDGFKVSFLPYINLPILKEISLMLVFWFALLKKRSSDTVVLSYNLFVYQSFALNFFRKKFKNRCVCLLADLSAGGEKKGLIGRFMRWSFDRYHEYSLKKCSYFIALNEYALKLYANPIKYMIMDGGVDPTEYPKVDLCWDGKAKKIVYSGALVDYSGILNLVDAMCFVEDPNIELNVYGNGPLVNEIIERSKRMDNVKYGGSVTNSEILVIQRQSWLLVNPRPVENDTAKVTFPSKIFEYMMSGRPVLSTRLNGFSIDYENLIYWLDGESPLDIARKINELSLLDDSVLNEKASAAKEFLMLNKTWTINAENVYRFLHDVKSLCK